MLKNASLVIALGRAALIVGIVVSVLCLGSSAFAWQMKQAPLMTDWAALVNPASPLPEYPRPQMVRTDWLNLNGVWQFKRGYATDPVPVGQELGGDILVPFAAESAISGVMAHYDRVWYRRTFTVPSAWNGKRVMLNCGAVDWEAEIYVNGTSVGVHQGGYDPFSYDITPYLNPSGTQEIIVRVYDPTDSGAQPRGKQINAPGGIFYTPTTGIWQTVWLEPVSDIHISSLKVVPDVDGGRVKVTVNTAGSTGGITVTATAKDTGVVVGSVTGAPNTELFITIPSAKLWSPDSPFLYDMDVSVKSGATTVDSASSYFGMRKVASAVVDGFYRLVLNGQFVFQIGPLDQGFWPDGIYTAPTDEALKWDIQLEKQLGYNCVRKHVKVEPARWYYWCDKLGLMVWQDMPSGNSSTTEEKTQFETELQRMVETHSNSPSIIMWIIFNEGWGQYDTVRLTNWVMGLDPSRLVSCASGWSDMEAGHVIDYHAYPHPSCPTSATRSRVCGEYGGIGYAITGHMWNPNSWGYTMVYSPEEWNDLYGQFTGVELPAFRDNNGLSAAIYTQITDVETEINGVATYDRKVIKPVVQGVKDANNFNYTPYLVYRDVVPIKQSWRYTTTTPAADWYTSGFNDSAWTIANAGFGTIGGAATSWTTSDIWIRRTFNPGSLTSGQRANLKLKMFHDQDAQVYINGVLASSVTGYNNDYQMFAINQAAKDAIVANATNTMAVHCYQTDGGQYIDAGIVEEILGPQYSITGTVTETGGASVLRATVYFSQTPNASANPACIAIADAAGFYDKRIANGTWYVCAGGSAYNTTADQILTMNSANVPNINFTLTRKPVVSGTVTDELGAPISSATVYVKNSPNASVNPAFTTTTDASGNYSVPVSNGTWYVCAGAVHHFTSADQVVTVNGANVAGINFTLVTGVLPVAYYQFEDNVTDTLGAYNGTAYNSPTYVTGKIGAKAIQFNGTNQYVTINRPVSTDFTIAFFVKTTQTSPTGSNWYNGKGLVDGEVGGVTNDFGISYLNSKVAFGVGNADTTVQSVSTINSGNWVHVACTRNASTGQMKVYINGVPETTGTGPTGTKSAPSMLHIGNLQTNINYFSGAIDNLKILDCVLLDSDIANLANEGTSFTITASAGTGGTITPNGAVVVSRGGNQTFNINANAGYAISQVTVDGVNQGPISTYTFTNVQTNHTISATFTSITYTITASAGANGSISPSGAVVVSSGGSQAFYMTPATDFQVDTVLVDGVSQGPITSYTFNNVTASHTISVTFKPNLPTPLVALDMAGLPDGTLSTWTNTGSVGGSFGRDTSTPTVGTVASKRCITFDGNDRFISTFNTPSAITANGSFTVAIWAYNPSKSSEECLLCWAARGGANGTSAQANFGSSTSLGAVGHTGTAYDMGFATQPSAGAWHHLCITFDGATEKVYVDGSPCGTEAKTLGMLSGYKLYIGVAYTTTYSKTRYFSGSIGPIRVFDTALTQSQITALYNQSW